MQETGTRRNEEELAKRLKTSLDDSCRPVLFLDSGIGGIPYLLWALEHIEGEEFVYVADRAHFPYGPRSHEELEAILVDLVADLLRRFRPKLVVLACNTASVVGLPALRARYEIPFVGVVPAIKPAASLTRTGVVGLLATERTLRDFYTDELIAAYANGARVVKVPSPHIVEFVEHRFIDAAEEERRTAVREAVERCVAQGADTIVLGCTHFVFLEAQIRSLAGEHVQVIDSREGVGRRLVHLLSYLPCGRRGPSTASFYLTGRTPPEGRYVRFTRHYGVSFGGVLE
ncbi:glutamate racemase [Spirochaeta thermophila]|uniref:Glutamate racemase n=1 Tax=Winmispira thermophila (strain ATCC 49972 / DSM 6192 / RI 19.B1) TaxID=665571 RepID=E0RNP9_WINT6|nr:glutamate racemase [Spirochaeta thermophila]ADN02640.1 glutamate racemase [Spirochaeta thermophila DSM 6192]